MMASNTYLLAPLRLLPTLGQNRFLLGQLAWRAFASRHAGSYLGWLWTPVSTVIQFVLFMVVVKLVPENLPADKQEINLKAYDMGVGMVE